MRSFAVLVFVVACSKAGEPPGKPCEGPADCADGKPFCIEGACVACDGPTACTMGAPRCEGETFECVGCLGDLDCGAYVAAPHCATDGACVGCISDSQCANPFPKCDDTTRACRACEADADCPSAACDVPTGVCLEESMLRYASPNGLPSDACTKSAPCSLAQAIAMVDPQHATVKLGAGSYPFTSISGAKTLTLHGYQAMFTGIVIADGANVDLRGLAIVDGLECKTTTNVAPSPRTTGADLRFTDTAFTAMIVAEDCQVIVTRSELVSTHGSQQVIAYDPNGRGAGEVTLTRSRITGGDALVVTGGGRLHLQNCVLEDVTGGAIVFTANGTGDASFSTFVRSPIDCRNAAQPLASFSNNIVFAPGNANAVIPTGTACTHRYSVVYPQTMDPPGVMNLKADPQLVAPAQGDYHIGANSPALDAADPTANATEDYEGSGRPQGLGRDIGAFERSP